MKGAFISWREVVEKAECSTKLGFREANPTSPGSSLESYIQPFPLCSLVLLHNADVRTDVFILGKLGGASTKSIILAGLKHSRACRAAMEHTDTQCLLRREPFNLAATAGRAETGAMQTTS